MDVSGLAKSRPLVGIEKKRYDPLTEITDPNETLSSMAIALRGVLPNACIFKERKRERDLIII
ncbi:hypothetical protein KUTeg_021458 [Tegillarca granosa]|uniref:Uncharacterized protein n=1 Tax=Tegillarca granosa TaxID=220873 RepID=A0ABQ9E6J3_TEGGR|nr:hypothetical protein KUTeg_021458 [Tegillarca granosa]